MITKILKKGKNSTISSLFAGIVVIMAMFMVVACEKEETSVANQQQTVRKPQPISDMEVMQYLPEVVDGRLVFKDSVAFDKYQTWVYNNQETPEKIIDLNKSLNFISMKEVYEKGLDLLVNTPSASKDYINSFPNVFTKIAFDNSIIYEIQTPTVLSYIVNKDGLYQVGNQIYRASYNYFYKINSDDESLISQLIVADVSGTTNNGIEVAPARVSSKDELYNNNDFDNTHRVVGRLRYGLYNGYYYIDAVASTQKRIAYVWVGYALDGVYLTRSTGYYYLTGGSTKYDITAGYLIGNQSVTGTIYMSTTRADHSRSYCTTVHYGEYDDETLSLTWGNVFTANSTY